MTPEDTVDLIRHSLFVAAEISAPVLIVLLLTGLIISILQSVTQISDVTLTFIPKLLCCSIAIVLCFPWMLKVILRFAHDVLVDHWNEVMSLALTT